MLLRLLERTLSTLPTPNVAPSRLTWTISARIPQPIQSLRQSPSCYSYYECIPSCPTFGETRPRSSNSVFARSQLGIRPRPAGSPAANHVITVSPPLTHSQRRSKRYDLRKDMCVPTDCADEDGRSKCYAASVMTLWRNEERLYYYIVRVTILDAAGEGHSCRVILIPLNLYRARRYRRPTEEKTSGRVARVQGTSKAASVSGMAARHACR